MEENIREELLIKAKSFFKKIIVENHVRNTKKAGKLKDYNTNPFLLTYLSNFFTGDNSADSQAKTLLYPRVLGTSITTSFGMNFQSFIRELLSAFASGIPGFDIEFDDKIDNSYKYCQLKAGPNTINKEDIETIENHFSYLRNKARLDGLKIGANDMIVGVLYGTHDNLSDHYLNIESHGYPVYVGKDLWHRLSGDINVYDDIINAIGDIAREADSTGLIERTLCELSNDIENSDLYLK